MNKFWLVLPLMTLTACDLSPDLQMPEITMPAMFKEDVASAEPTVEPAADGKWKRLDEKAKIEEIAWWRMFNDPTLDSLEEAAMKDNPTLEVAASRVTSARAAARIADADLYPTVTAGFGPTRQRLSPASINASSPPGFKVDETKPYTLYSAQGTITYEADIFGKNRNSSLAALLGAEGEEENYRAARLSLQADIAQAYFAYAALAMEQNILTDTAKSQEESLGLTRKKREIGEIDDLQVAAAETDLANVKLASAQVAQQKALQEHLLAILTGKSPAEFMTPKASIHEAPPVVPAGLPSSLLERRPDIQVAAKDIAAANARIGVARAGYFPDISLTILGGFTSSELGDLFKWSNRTWMIGPLAGTMLTQPIFQGGRVAASVAQSKSEFQGSVANYKASVLQAFREVEDQLSGLRHLSDQAAASSQALNSAQRAFNIAEARYKVGYSSYLEFLDAQRNLLNAQRADVEVMGNRYVTTVQLVKALGGSWPAGEPKLVLAPVEKQAPLAAAKPAAKKAVKKPVKKAAKKSTKKKAARKTR